MTGQTRKYRLFAMAYCLENVDFAAGFRFSRVTPEYILIYTKKARMKQPPVGRAAEIKEGDLALMNGMDRAWLLDCGASIFAELAAQRKGENLKQLSDMVDRLEKELEIEAEKEGAGA